MGGGETQNRTGDTRIFSQHIYPHVYWALDSWATFGDMRIRNASQPFS